MKTALVIDSVSRAAGGLLDAERCLHQGLGRLGVNTAVFALEDEHTVADLSGWAPLVPTVFPHQGPSALGAASDLRRAILAEPADLIYRAGLWRLPSRYAHEWSRRHGRPEIIAPHGMLDPWAVRNSRWKKRLAHLWFEGSHLRDASCIRALCEAEAQAVRAYGLKNPVCVIPNGIDLPEIRDQNAGRALANPEQSGAALTGIAEGNSEVGGRRSEDRPRVLLFLGRLHPKKGLVNALKAWHQVRGQRSEIRGQEEWQFVVAGWDQGGHEADLKRLCDELGLSYLDLPASDYVGETPTLLESSVRSSKFEVQCSTFASSSPANTASVIFTGPAFGATKDELLRRAGAFILPSFSEGLPMSVLEAWAYGLPVLMTDHCNLPEGFLSDAALRIGTDVASIAAVMSDFLRSPASDLRAMGANGRALVERQFTWPQVAAQMKEVYEWVLGGGGAPGCVE